MKFKHREFVLGIILGSIIWSTFSIFANEAFDISINPFKIMVNGAEKNIEGYNINGSTYFKLRDIGREVGFNVDFKKETIIIETDKNTMPSSSSKLTSNLYNYITIDNTEYIASKDVDFIVMNYYYPNWIFSYTNNKNSWTEDDKSWCYLNKLDGNNKSISEYKISCTFINDVSYITKEVFENDILKRITK